MKKWWIGAVAALVVLAILFVLPIRPVHSQVPSYTLQWTAPGDDGNVGTATSYEMRWSTTQPDTTSSTAMNAWWAAATAVPNMPTPLIAGTQQSVDVMIPGGFMSGKTYYFVIRTSDEVPNVSGYSNVAAKFTPDTLPPAPIFDLH